MARGPKIQLVLLPRSRFNHRGTLASEEFVFVGTVLISFFAVSSLGKSMSGISFSRRVCFIFQRACGEAKGIRTPSVGARHSLGFSGGWLASAIATDRLPRAYESGKRL